jgi:hypothetical protein
MRLFDPRESIRIGGDLSKYGELMASLTYFLVVPSGAPRNDRRITA